MRSSSPEVRIEFAEAIAEIKFQADMRACLDPDATVMIGETRTTYAHGVLIDLDILTAGQEIKNVTFSLSQIERILSEHNYGVNPHWDVIARAKDIVAQEELMLRQKRANDPVRKAIVWLFTPPNKG